MDAMDLRRLSAPEAPSAESEPRYSDKAQVGARA